MNFLKKLFNKFFNAKPTVTPTPTSSEMAEAMQKAQARQSFLTQYCYCLNPDTPAQDRFSKWVFGKRYCWGNLCTPEGFCYIFKVLNESKYMEALIEYFQEIGITFNDLWIFSPETGSITVGQENKAFELPVYFPETVKEEYVDRARVAFLEKHAVLIEEALNGDDISGVFDCFFWDISGVHDVYNIITPDGTCYGVSLAPRASMSAEIMQAEDYFNKLGIIRRPLWHFLTIPEGEKKVPLLIPVHITENEVIISAIGYTFGRENSVV